LDRRSSSAGLPARALQRESIANPGTSPIVL
jgi:hypothetical protein